MTDRTYLDWAASAPVLPAVMSAVQQVLGEVLGNPSAIHAEGRQARQHIEAARESIARAYRVQPAAVTFTSGGTEANNLAIRGHLESLAASGRAYTDMTVLTTAIEHPATSATLAAYAARGVTVRHLPLVPGTGRIDQNQVAAQCDDSVVLLTLGLVNSEIGTVQSVRSIAQMVAQQVRAAGAAQAPLVHVDAAQAALWCNCAPGALGADLVSLDAAKVGGLLGSGVLLGYAPVVPVQTGGGQERGRRSGTEALCAVVGAGIALPAAQEEWRSRADAVRTVRDAAIVTLPKYLPGAVINGPVGGDRVANNINISIPGLDTEYAAVVLDTHGFAVSTKSACAGAGGGASAVVAAVTGDAARARSTLRFTIGPDTTVESVAAAFSVLAAHIKQQSRLTKQ